MKRPLIAAAWLVGAVVPLFAATVFVVGCCVLPFHGLLHHVMPLCHLASDVMRGEHADHDADRQHPPAEPARERQEPARATAAALAPAQVGVAATTFLAGRAIALDAGGYRSFIALGALRCDQDIGLHRLLNQTFRI